jgi:hypothetical protein
MQIWNGPNLENAILPIRGRVSVQHLRMISGSSANGRLAPCLRGVLERSGRQKTVLSDTGYKATAIGSGVSRNPHRWDAAKLWRNQRSIRGSKSRSATRVRSASANSGRVPVSPTQTRCREIQPWPVVGKKREPRLTGQPGPSVCMRGQRVWPR